MDATRCGHKTFQDTRGSCEAWRSKPDPEQEECSLTFRHTGSRRRSGVSLARDSIAHGNTNVPSRYAQLSILPFSTPFVDFNPLPQTTNGKLSLLLSPRISINRKIVQLRRVHVANRNRESLWRLRVRGLDVGPRIKSIVEFLWPISLTTTSTLLVVVEPLSLYVSLEAKQALRNTCIYIHTRVALFFEAGLSIEWNLIRRGEGEESSLARTRFFHWPFERRRYRETDF